ncbi:MAG: septum formation initiator family protein [Gemmatimonadota bacterium]
MTPVRWGAVAVVIIALIFAWSGGEYSTGDWLILRRQVSNERATVAALTASLDSLQVVAGSIEHDPAEQERVAREEFGMIRQGEYLYRLVAPADSAGNEK